MVKHARSITFAAVRDIGRSLQGVEESTMYGSPALKVNGVWFACMAVHQSAEPDSLAIRIGFEQRGLLLAEAPDTYYLTPHYVDYPTVLVRLGRVTPDALKDLLAGAHHLAAEKTAKRPRPRRRRL